MLPRRLPKPLEYRGLLGETGFGATSVASRPNGTAVAVKDVTTQLYTELGRVKLEQKIAKIHPLKHPNLTEFFETYTGVPDHFYITSEYLAGGSLKDEIARRRFDNRPFTEEQIWEVVAQILQGLAYLHARMKANCPGVSCVTYGNLKPSNVMFDDAECATTRLIKLTDYYIRPDVTHLLFATSQEDYSICYKAPEVLLGQELTEKQDIWSLGAILLEMCTLSFPSILKASSKTPEAFSTTPDCEVPRRFSSAVRVFLSNTLLIDPAKRLSAAELLMFPVIADALARLDFKYAPSDDLRQTNVAESVMRAVVIESVSTAPQSVTVTHVRQDSQPAPAPIPEHAVPQNNDISVAQLNSPESTDHSMLDSLAVVPEAPIDTARPLSPQPLRNTVTILEASLAPNSTDLHQAALRGDYEAAKKLLHLVRQRNDAGLTALMVAAQQNQTEVCKLLLEHECYMRDKKGFTALMYAAHKGNASCAKVLLDREGGFMCHDGTTAILIANKAGHSDVVETLRAKEEIPRDEFGNTNLILAAARGDMTSVKSHLGEVRCTNKQGMTALHFATENNYVEIVKLLAPEECKIHRIAANGGLGLTALMIAAAQGNIECASILAKYEAGMQKHHGWTALMFAAQNGNDEVVKLLADKEAGKRIKGGWTAMMLAAKGNFTKSIGYLLPFEAGLTMDRGLTALIFAVEKGHEESIRLLAPKEGNILVGEKNRPADYAKLRHIKMMLLSFEK